MQSKLTGTHKQLNKSTANHWQIMPSFHNSSFYKIFLFTSYSARPLPALCSSLTWRRMFDLVVKSKKLHLLSNGIKQPAIANQGIKGKQHKRHNKIQERNDNGINIQTKKHPGVFTGFEHIGGNIKPKQQRQEIDHQQ